MSPFLPTYQGMFGEQHYQSHHSFHLLHYLTAPHVANNFGIALLGVEHTLLVSVCLTCPRQCRFFLQTGRPWPAGCCEEAEAGKQIANGFYLSLLSVTGDIEWHHEGLKLRHPLSGNPCSRCQANTVQNDKPWTDIKMSAQWRRHVWDLETFREAFPDSVAIFHLPTCSIEQLHFDLMHTKSLGCDQWLLGSWISYMVRYKKVALPDLWLLIKRHYQVCRAMQNRKRMRQPEQKENETAPKTEGQQMTNLVLHPVKDLENSIVLAMIAVFDGEISDEECCHLK